MKPLPRLLSLHGTHADLPDEPPYYAVNDTLDIYSDTNLFLCRDGRCVVFLLAFLQLYSRIESLGCAQTHLLIFKQRGLPADTVLPCIGALREVAVSLWEFPAIKY